VIQKRAPVPLPEQGHARGVGVRADTHKRSARRVNTEMEIQPVNRRDLIGTLAATAMTPAPGGDQSSNNQLSPVEL